MTLFDVQIRTGPFVSRVTSNIPAFRDEFERLYSGHPGGEAGGFSDFHVAVKLPAGPRRWIRPQVVFENDGTRPFQAFPVGQAGAVFEWGLNWAISTTSYTHLMIHAAVVGRGEAALILPGTPGSGKSTIAAALVAEGWRLLTDEIALLVPDSATLMPLVRPISLKNQSIDIIRARAPDAVFSRTVLDTHKGSLALLRPPAASVAAMRSPAEARWLVFPRYAKSTQPLFAAKSRAMSFHALARNAFNYEIHGESGFRTLARLISQVECRDLVFDDLDYALAAIRSLTG
jgi:HprK-related kinase A